ncbi:outer membrane protein [Sphingomonas sp. SRS2]|uniref:outer membrane protein n=1 Tax=Sphingomonas sp. SRS2 TaxID=133190 RepID=UPI00061840BA|nr:porin family protein [Sphingomonas sp. SRS2]KKC26489.1 opacity protein and related surface antigens-like protein [Sphingomonas sp. SRS2]
MRSIVVAALFAASAATPALAQDKAPFTGARVEALAGWDRVQNNGHDDGIGYGLGVGYDFQTGMGLVGVEAEATDSSVKQCVGSTTVADPRLCAKAGRDLYVGGRVGAVVGGSTLLYAKAGYTNARAKLTGNDGTGTVGLGSTDLDGVRVGVGAEYAITGNSFVKTEYRYSNYENGFSRNQVTAGFGFRF